jgi:hypothetical protein
MHSRDEPTGDPASLQWPLPMDSIGDRRTKHATQPNSDRDRTIRQLLGGKRSEFRTGPNGSDRRRAPPETNQFRAFLQRTRPESRTCGRRSPRRQERPTNGHYQHGFWRDQSRYACGLLLHGCRWRIRPVEHSLARQRCVAQTRRHSIGHERSPTDRLSTVMRTTGLTLTAVRRSTARI